MNSPNDKVIEFRCGLDGVFSKVAPDLLKQGQYRAAMNVVSNQEGSISSRTGVKALGTLTSAEPTCYFIRKLVKQSGEDPLTPSANPRYLGVLTTAPSRNIYRTTDYATTPDLVATAVDSVAARHWEMADYAAGEAGIPWAYFACPNFMLKDRSATPYTTLKKWGIGPAEGVVLGTLLTGSVAVATIAYGYGTVWPGVVVTLAADASMSDDDFLTISGVAAGLTLTTTDGRTDINDTWGIRPGLPDGSGNINYKTTLFRIFDNNGQMVTASGAYVSGGTVAGLTTPGNLDGGANSSANETQPYDWRTVYEETDTGDAGNPSQPMSDASTATLVDSGLTYATRPIAVHNGSVKLMIWGSADTRIGFIRVYRRGGILFDAWRLVARVANPGNETKTIITDNTADADLQFKELLETDNDPPVTSSIAPPIRSMISGGVAIGWQTANLTSSVFGPVTPGTVVTIIDPAGSEDVYVESATSNSFRAFFQFAHASGIPVEVGALTGQPCNLAMTMRESILVAGDPNNPHTLYKSKNARPQSFPVGSDAAGAVTSIGVGTPANGIVNFTECRGQVLCMNVSALFEVAIVQSSLQEPARVSEKGLRGQSAWCKDDTGQVWYLSDDGVYTWNGGSGRKRTEAIDPIFHGQQFAGIPPLDMSAAAAAAARMEYRRGTIHLLYTDIAGNVRELACEPMYNDRWTPMREDVYETSSPQYPVTMLYREPDTQSLIVAANNPLLGAQFGIADVTVVASGVNQTSDWWTSAPTNGGAIPWSLTLPWFDMGNPAVKKMFEEVWLDCDPQIYTGVYSRDSTMQVDLLLDYSETPVESFTIAIASGDHLTGRQILALLPNLVNTSGSIYQSYGREARAISFKLSGVAYPTQFTLYSIVIQYEVVGLLTAGAAGDWMDLGTKHDKRLYQMAVIFDTAGTDRHITLEMRGGKTGKTVGNTQIFTLSSPTDLGSGRCLCLFPLAEPTIAKLVRVRPYASAAISSGNTKSSIDLFRIFEVDFPDKEEYPPDVVILTPWDDGGYGYLKYANQVVLQCNTNGVTVTVKLQADGADSTTFTVNSTEADRQRVITLPPGLVGYRWRLTCDPAQSAIASGAGMFQLWAHHFAFQQADKGEVGHSFDWDDLAHPYDKELLSVTFEYDTTSGGPVTLQMDTIGGIGGTTLTANVIRFTLGSGRGKTTFPLPADTVVKMVRVYPVSNSVGYKQWRYSFDKIAYPADTVRVTGWKDASAPVDKEPSWLWIDADTSNVAASVQLQNEAGTLMTVSHTGTSNNRKKNYAIAADSRAKMWRLVSAEGGGGRFQLFDWGFERWNAFPLTAPIDPPEIVLATPWTDWGYPYGKLARDMVVTINTGGVACSIALQTTEGGTVATFPVTTTAANRRVVLSPPANLQGTLWRLVLTPGGGGIAQLWDWFLDTVKMPPALTRWSSYKQGFGYWGWKFAKQAWFDYLCAGTIAVTFTSDTGSTTITLPARSTRSVERTLFSAVWGAGLDKSKLYQVDMVANDTTKPFQMFTDLSGIEWLPCGADRHTAYQRTTLSEMMPIAA